MLGGEFNSNRRRKGWQICELYIDRSCTNARRHDCTERNCAKQNKGFVMELGQGQVEMLQKYLTSEDY